ncbi:MAG: primosomal protein N', partial [Planctomycetota bacterium]
TSSAFLLKGVTGSGKTEIYLRAIAREVEAGRQALVLVPEISLTPQTLRRFRSRFNRLAVLHSALTDAQRSRQWEKINRGEADVVIGARSAIFAPLSRLGLIVVDEEHDASFKQQSTPRYSARDLALVRAKFEGARAILGSATPQLESWWNAGKGKLHLLSLPRRAGALPLPPVSVLDMSLEARPGEDPPLVSRKAVILLAECLKEGRQAMLLMNRRGFSSALSCLKCRAIPRCPGCDIALTVHKGLRRLMCHYCAHAQVLSDTCSTCGGGPVRPLGSGTERLEEVLANAVPGLRVLRMDADSTRRRGSHQEILDAFRRGEADALLGTQMIAKGHDFPRVSLVIVLDADVGLNLPDFRAGERTFSLITQVAGRAGRKEGDGRVIVQTQHPRNPAIDCASRHDVDGYLERESALRRPLMYPPHGRLARVVCSAPDDDTAQLLAGKVRERLGAPANVVVLGPAPCPLARIDGESRMHLLLKAPVHAPLLSSLRPLAESPPKVAEAKMVIDVDPVTML